jgi:predicted Zn-dependent protease
VSIVDDGTPSGGPAGIPFDDEGVPTRRTEVVSRGELRAQLGGLPLAVATGNARRAGWRHGLTVTPSNMYLVPDGPDRVDLGALCGDGVYVEQISGVRRRVVDLTTTRLQLTLRGAAVHRGETVGPVQGLLGLTGVSLLSAVRAVRGATRFYRVNGVFGGSECVLDGIDVAFA